MILDPDSIEAGGLAQLTADHPGVRIAVLAERPTRRQIHALVAQGACAVLSLQTTVADLIAALRLALRGLWVAAPHEDPCDSLTEAERTVHILLCGGRSNAMIADTLHLGTETIRTHAKRIYAKLGVSGRNELLVHAGDRQHH